MSRRAFAPESKASSSFACLILIALLATLPSSCAEPGKLSDTPASPGSLLPTTWAELLEQTPYPYASPLPPAGATALDGTYVRIEPTSSTPAVGTSATPTPPGGGAWMWHPVRPTVWVMPPGPYSVRGGGWILSLDRGIFRIVHQATGWHTLGSFTVSGNRIEFYNDPYCMKSVGRYEWTLTAGQLTLELVEDGCGGQAPFQSGPEARAAILTELPWTSWQPP